MNILLTGSNGFLGRNIIEVLKKEHHLVGLSRSSGEYQICLDKEVPNFQNFFDLVIHSAGKAHSIPTTEFERQQFHQVNVVGTLNLLNGLEMVGVPKHFIFISSVAVYGKKEGIGIDENFALLAKDAYGLSKIEAERVVINWCHKNNVICTILRLPLLVGENPPGNLGAMLQAIDKGYYFNIGGGKSRKSMVLAQDVAAFIPVVSLVGGVYNLTDGYHPSFNELSTAITILKHKIKPFNMPLFVAKIIGFVGDLLGEKVPMNTLKLKKITSDLSFDDSRARNSLNWKPRPVLEYLKTKSI